MRGWGGEASKKNACSDARGAHAAVREPTPRRHDTRVSPPRRPLPLPHKKNARLLALQGPVNLGAPDEHSDDVGSPQRLELGGAGGGQAAGEGRRRGAQGWAAGSDRQGGGAPPAGGPHCGLSGGGGVERAEKKEWGRAGERLCKNVFFCLSPLEGPSRRTRAGHTQSHHRGVHPLLLPTLCLCLPPFRARVGTPRAHTLGGARSWSPYFQVATNARPKSPPGRGLPGGRPAGRCGRWGRACWAGPAAGAPTAGRVGADAAGKANGGRGGRARRALALVLGKGAGAGPSPLSLSPDTQWTATTPPATAAPSLIAEMER